MYVRFSQGGEGLKCVKCSWSDGCQLVVIKRQQTDIMEPCETVIMYTAYLVVPQHPKVERN